MFRFEFNSRIESLARETLDLRIENTVDVQIMQNGGEMQSLSERILHLGPQALTSSELMRLLLDDGPVVTGLVRRLMTKFRNLHALARCTPKELVSVKGMTMKKATRLAASFELARHLTKEILLKVKVDNPEIVCQLVAQDLRALSRESLRVILLDTKFQLLRIEEISLGSLNENLAHPREVLRPALIHSAYAMILVHNHPSGDPTPSSADKKLTQRIVEASRLLGVELADHIIIGERLADKDSYFSFKEAELL